MNLCIPSSDVHVRSVISWMWHRPYSLWAKGSALRWAVASRLGCLSGATYSLCRAFLSCLADALYFHSFHARKAVVTVLSLLSLMCYVPACILEPQKLPSYMATAWHLRHRIGAQFVLDRWHVWWEHWKWVHSEHTSTLMPSKNILRRLINILLPKAPFCSTHVWMPRGCCKQTKSWHCFPSQRRNGNGLHRQWDAACFGCWGLPVHLPAGAPYSLACPPSCWLAHAHIANHAWSSAPFSCASCHLSFHMVALPVCFIFLMVKNHIRAGDGPTLSLLCTQTSVLGQVVDRHGKFRLLLLLMYVVLAKT